ncbi:hypothetical protein [Thiomicrospira microaerophila]|uniref:hypothetical protein n=1 Tax=Thiomicrospira microaerophila TaxID=406020 RepID=UPI0005C8F092|nr:hypothetical protein [Thiomicrospira microaerophila]
MKVSLDISMYPLDQHFVEPILAFIARLEQQPGLVIKRNSLSTQVFGDLQHIMQLMTDEITEVFNQNPNTVFVLKLVGQDRSD